jgi:DNA polymerase I
VSRPLLVVDGDSFAHRAYHALPKSIKRVGGRPANLLIGVADMISGLWHAERPRAVVVGWDSLEHPTYRHEAFAGYQAGREFDDALLEQLDLAPELIGAMGFVCAKAPGYEADDFLAAAVAASEGPALVATSDRDAFQLVSDRVTVLKPLRGISKIERIGPDDVRERYGVEPEQVPDFIALRGDPSDRIPGARGVGEKGAADLLRRFGTLEALLEAGRFPAEADALRLYRRIATLDATAPLPPVVDAEPTWERAAALAAEWELEALARRLEAAASSS